MQREKFLEPHAKFTILKIQNFLNKELNVNEIQIKFFEIFS